MKSIQQPPPADRQLIQILLDRDGTLTRVKLMDGRLLDVWDIAYGYDMGDAYAHITANMEKREPPVPMHFFSSEHILRIIDGVSGVTLYRNTRC